MTSNASSKSDKIRVRSEAAESTPAAFRSEPEAENKLPLSILNGSAGTMRDATRGFGFGAWPTAEADKKVHKRTVRQSRLLIINAPPDLQNRRPRQLINVCRIIQTYSARTQGKYA